MKLKTDGMIFTFKRPFKMRSVSMIFLALALFCAPTTSDATRITIDFTGPIDESEYFWVGYTDSTYNYDVGIDRSQHPVGLEMGGPNLAFNEGGIMFIDAQVVADPGALDGYSLTHWRAQHGSFQMLWDSRIYSATLHLSEGENNRTFREWGGYQAYNGLNHVGGDGYSMTSPFEGDAITLNFIDGFDYLQIAYYPFIESITYRTDPIPEPATMLLLGTGLTGILGLGRKKFKK